jgi:hypothetical protein
MIKLVSDSFINWFRGERLLRSALFMVALYHTLYFGFFFDQELVKDNLKVNYFNQTIYNPN